MGQYVPADCDSASAVIEDDTKSEARRLIVRLRVVRDLTEAEASKREGGQ